MVAKAIARGIQFALVLCLTAFVASSQGIPTQEPIAAKNIARHTELTNLSLGVGGTGFWSDDGITLYYGTSAGIYVFDIHDLTKRTFIKKLPEHLERRYKPIDENLDSHTKISPDGQLSLSLSLHPENERWVNVTITDIASGQILGTVVSESPLYPQRYSFAFVMPRFAHDGAILYARDNSLYQWTRNTPRERLLLEARRGRELLFTDVQLNPQGTFAATYTVPTNLSWSITLRLYDLQPESPELLIEFTLPAQDSWHSVAISPDGTHIAAGGNNDNLRIWTLADGPGAFRDDRPPNEHAETPVVDLTYTPDGRYLAGSVNSVGSGHAFLRDAQTGEEVVRIAGVSGTGYSFWTGVAAHPHMNQLAFGAADGNIRLWMVDDLLAQKELSGTDATLILQAHTGPVVDLNFSPDGSQLAAASWDGTVSVWSMTTHERIGLFHLGQKVWSAVFSPDGAHLATSDESGSVLLWDLNGETSQLIDSLPPLDEYQDDRHLVDLAFSLDGSLLAGIQRKGGILIWDLATLERMTLEDSDSGWHLRFSSDGHLLTAADVRGNVRVWGIAKATNDE